MSITRKKLFKSSFLAILILGLIMAWLGFGDRGFLHLYRMEKNRKACIDRIRKIEKENQDLIEEIRRLNTDTAYLESVARKELGLVKENEILYRFSRSRSDHQIYETERKQEKEQPAIEVD